MLAILLVLAVNSGVTVGDRTCEIVDLSHDFNSDTVYWPTAKSFTLTRVHKGPAGPEGKRFFYSANNYDAAEHGGTHLDAPIHFSRTGITADKVPLEKLMGKACIIDVVEKSRNWKSKDSDYLISTRDFTSWESKYGLLNDCILLIRTGWASYWPNRKEYLGADDGTADNLQFPGIDPNAAKWLVRNRRVKAVGLDTASLDSGRSTTFDTHQILAAANIPGLENLKNLNELPEFGATVMALPMKIYGGSGAPTRIIAFKTQDNIASCLGLTSRANLKDPTFFIMGLLIYFVFCFI